MLRYFLGSAHYRSVLEFSENSLAEADAAFSRIESFLKRAAEQVQVPHEIGAGGMPEAFVTAMLDDFAVPQALAALHETVRAGNIAIEASDQQALLRLTSETYAMLNVLGLNPNDEAWLAGSADDSAVTGALDALVQGMIAERRAAREAKDFAASDAIRDRLTAAGIALEDTQNETRWSLT